MYLGIDLGTSAIKVILMDEGGALVAQASSDLDVSRPQPLWSEQDPEDWWSATNDAIGQLRQSHGDVLASVRGIGLSGQMHGATLLDAQDRVLRPAILWNDGRSAAECESIEMAEPNSRTITGNIAMPGFTAPKLLWVKNHEPEVFDQVAKVLLPKDYVRLRMTGDYASDQSDSAGTLWLDVANRKWSSAMLDTCGLSEDQMPKLFEGTEVTGTLLPAVAEAWGLSPVPVAGGAGDNAAGAAGVGVVTPGTGFLSLGTSGVLFVSNAGYLPNPDGAVHTFCHCIPDRWHQMAVILSAASCLTWVTKLVGAKDEGSIIDQIEANADQDNTPIFLPYLSGERTPHNDPHAKGAFFGMTHETTSVELGLAVLEGVAFAFADGQQALIDAGTDIGDVTVIGGGSRSAYWAQIIANVLQRPLTLRDGGEVGPAYGAARLGQIAAEGADPEQICTAPPISQTIDPDSAKSQRYSDQLQRYRDLYAQTRSLT